MNALNIFIKAVFIVEALIIFGVIVFPEHTANYDKGYTQGQVDCINGVVKIDSVTTYKLKQ
jgi:hypothetical protein